MGDCKDEIYCDVLPMDVAHVLIGRPWPYDLNVTNFGKDNIYSFKCKGKNIILRPVKLKVAMVNVTSLNFLNGICIFENVRSLRERELRLVCA